VAAAVTASRGPPRCAPQPGPDYDVHPKNVSGEGSSNTVSRSLGSPSSGGQREHPHLQARRSALSSSGEAASAVVVDQAHALRDMTASRLQ
jgi:hypothetical protein